MSAGTHSTDWGVAVRLLLTVLLSYGPSWDNADQVDKTGTLRQSWLVCHGLEFMPFPLRGIQCRYCEPIRGPWLERT